MYNKTKKIWINILIHTSDALITKIAPLNALFRQFVFGSKSPVARLCRAVNNYSDVVDVHHDSPLKSCKKYFNLFNSTK